MKKITFLLLGLLFALSAAAQTQKGYVKTCGRPGPGGTYVPGKRLSGVFLKVRGRQGTRSDARGEFVLSVGRNFYLERAEKPGYELVDRDALVRRYDYSAGSPLVVVMEDMKLYRQTINNIVCNFRLASARQYENRLGELKCQLEVLRITQARYDSLINDLNESQSRSEKLIADLAERYAAVDFDQESGLNRRIQACILEGDLQKADSLLRSKGDLHARAAALQRHRELNAAEAEELERRHERLDRSRRLAAHDLEELAADCRRRHELCLLEHRNDSAAHYIELRAALDTANAEWALEAGKFVYEYKADQAGALRYFERALRNAKAQYGEGHPNVAVCYNEMGLAYWGMGNYPEALSCYSLALEIFRPAYGEEHPSVASCHFNMGNVHEIRGNYARALSDDSLALRIRKAVYGESHPDVADCYLSIGNVYSAQGNYALALTNYDAALTIYKAVYGERHPSAANCRLNMGNVHRAQGNYDAALANYDAALTIYKTVYGGRHPFVAGCYNGMAIVHKMQGNGALALSELSLALDIYKSAYGDSHPKVADCYNNLGVLYAHQGIFSVALAYAEKALSIYRRHLPEDAPDIVETKTLVELIKLYMPAGE